MCNNLQRTTEWHTARLGHLTASGFARAFSWAAKSYGKPMTSAIIDVATERVTGIHEDIFPTAAMQYGIDHEEDARKLYEIETGECVELVGFMKHPSIEWFGASPDGLVGTDGLIEIKCPSRQKHLERIVTGEIPNEYKKQMLVQLSVTGRNWCDFVDFRDDFPARHRLLVIRFEPNPAEIAAVEEQAKAFLAEVKKCVEVFEEK